MPMRRAPPPGRSAAAPWRAHRRAPATQACLPPCRPPHSADRATPPPAPPLRPQSLPQGRVRERTFGVLDLFHYQIGCFIDRLDGRRRPLLILHEEIRIAAKESPALFALAEVPRNVS